MTQAIEAGHAARVRAAQAGGRMARHRMGEWLRRYGPAEIAGTVTALGGSFAVHALTGNEIAAAYGGAMGENLGFYGVIITREIRKDARDCRARGEPYGTSGARRTGRNLLLEFGLAELLDTGVLRPLAMGLCTQWFGRELGVVIGKFVADFTFYVPVVCFYELRRALERRRVRS